MRQWIVLFFCLLGLSSNSPAAAQPVPYEVGFLAERVAAIDSANFALGGWNGEVAVFNAANGSIKHLGRHTAMIRSIAANTKHIVSGSADGDVKIWDVKSGKLLRTISHESDHVTTVAVTVDSSMIATGTFSGETIRIWDPMTGELQRTFVSFGSLPQLDFSANGRYLVSGSLSGGVRIFDPKKGTIIKEYGASASGVYGVRFMPDNITVATVSFSNFAKSLHHYNMENETSTTGFESSERITSFDLNKKGAATFTQFAVLKVWDSKNAVVGEYKLYPVANRGSGVAFSSNGQWLVAAGYTGTVHVLHLQ